jgi:hypothetical protein
MRLNSRIRNALYGFDGGGYGETPSSVPRVGQKTIDELIIMGCLEECPTMYNEFGYSTTEKGLSFLSGK